MLLLPITLLDKNKNHWFPESDSFQGIVSKPVYHLFDFLICLQLCIVYLHSSIAKIAVPEWRDGSAIYYWFTHESFGGNYFILTTINYILNYKYLTYLLCWSAIGLELLISFMLFVPKNRKLPLFIFPIAILFHFFILIIFGIFTFSITMMAALVFYFKYFDQAKNLTINK